ncbi:hypothetical protein FRC10_000946, partial [Ceratobasidium sp. 414]
MVSKTSVESLLSPTASSISFTTMPTIIAPPAAPPTPLPVESPPLTTILSLTTSGAEQEWLDRLFVSEPENLKHAEESFYHKRQHRSVNAHDHNDRLLHDEELCLCRECEPIVKLCADNNEWLSHLIKQETDRIHAAIIEDELANHLSPKESEWLERNIKKHAAEEQCQSEEDAEHAAQGPPSRGGRGHQ